MKIEAIEIDNFRGCSHFYWDTLEGSLLLIGYNGTGKSSILAAIQWALTNKLYDYRGNALTLKQLVGADASKTARVKLRISHGDTWYTLEAETNQKSSSVCLTPEKGERIVGTDLAREALFRFCGFDMKHAHASAHPQAFVLSKDLYVRLNELGGGLDLEALKKHCGENWPWLESWCKEMRQSMTDVRDLKNIGKAAYEQRTHVNGEVKRLDQHLEEFPQPPEGLDITKKAAAEERIAALRQQRDQLISLRAVAANGRSAEEIAAAAQELRNQMLALPELPNVAKFEADLTRVQQQHSENSQKGWTTNNELESLKKQLAATKGGTCPTCKQPIASTMSAEAVQELQIKIVEKEAEFAELKASSDTILKSIQPARDALSKAQAEAREIDRQRAALEAKLAQVEAETPAGSFDQAALDEVEQRIARGEKMIHDITVETQRLKTRDDRKRNAELAGKLTWAVEQFRDGAAQSAIGKNAQQEFVEAVNGVLNEHGYTLSLEHSDGSLGAYLLKEGRAKPVPIQEVSKAELLLVTVAIAEALGAGFVLVDEVEALDFLNRGPFFGGMRDGGEGPQYIAAATYVKKELPDAAAISNQLGCAVYWMGGEHNG